MLGTAYFLFNLHLNLSLWAFKNIMYFKFSSEDQCPMFGEDERWSAASSDRELDEDPSSN